MNAKTMAGFRQFLHGKTAGSLTDGRVILDPEMLMVYDLIEKNNDLGLFDEWSDFAAKKKSPSSPTGVTVDLVDGCELNDKMCAESSQDVEDTDVTNACPTLGELLQIASYGIDDCSTQLFDKCTESYCRDCPDDDMVTCNSSGPTLAELNAVCQHDEFESLEESFALSNCFNMSELLQKDARKASPGLLPSAGEICSAGMANMPDSKSSQDGVMSRVADPCLSRQRVLPPVSDFASPQRRTRHDTDSSSGGWHCQIVPHSPVDPEPWKNQPGVTNSVPVLKLQKRTFSQSESGGATGSFFQSGSLVEEMLEEQPEYQVKRTKKDADVQSRRLSQPEHVGRHRFDSDDENSGDDENYNSSDDALSDEEEFLPNCGSTHGHSSSSSNNNNNNNNIDLQKRYFWLYNIQAKGPKGHTASRVVGPSDPHVLHSFRDPALDDASAHKGRRSSGSDVDANPRRLLTIGNELNRLGAIIGRNGADEKALSPREKNKYASRICRLKRKAQHEANKIKLQGLDSEHSQLMKVLTEIRAGLVDRVRNRTKTRDEPTLTTRLEFLMKTNLTDMIAEHTDEYVRSIIEQTNKEPRLKNLRRSQ